MPSRARSNTKKRSDLRKHIKIHTGEKPNKCVDISNQFTLSNHLRSHMRIHTGEKPYKCEDCGSQFTQRNGLKTHMRIHTGEKPYKCKNCVSQFTQSDNQWNGSRPRLHSLRSQKRKNVTMQWEKNAWMSEKRMLESEKKREKMRVGGNNQTKGKTLELKAQYSWYQSGQECHWTK